MRSIGKVFMFFFAFTFLVGTIGGSKAFAKGQENSLGVLFVNEGGFYNDYIVYSVSNCPDCGSTGADSTISEHYIDQQCRICVNLCSVRAFYRKTVTTCFSCRMFLREENVLVGALHMPFIKHMLFTE